MAKYGSDDIVITFDEVGDSPTNMSAYGITINGWDREAIVEEITRFGNADAVFAAVGLNKASPIEIGGKYDDTGSVGPDAVFNLIGTTKTLKITWGGSKTTEVETIITHYKRIPSIGKLTEFVCTVQPTGAHTEA